MGYNYLFLIFIFIIAFIQAPKPENIKILNIDDEKESYEINVLKNEIFGFQFTRGRGTNCYWSHSNDKLLKESNYLHFLNSTTWDYISEEYEKAKNNSNSQIETLFGPIIGGNEYYYELFKALDGGNQPQLLYFTLSCGDDIYQKASVNVWICDEINKDQCVNEENICNNSLTEKECISAKAINPKTSKCVYDKKQKVCKEEKKSCYEIKAGATEDICTSSQVSGANKICAFDNETNSCIEFSKIKTDAGNLKNNISLYCFLSLLLLFI